jgi:type II secretory pathway pseudopilin PulG
MTGRDRIVIVVVVALALVVGSWLLVIQPKRSEASKLGSQISSAEAQLSTARSTVMQNEAARAEFSGDYSELVRLGEAVPADDNVPSLLYELQSAADAAHVNFQNLVLNPATSGSTPTTSSSSSSSSKSSSSSSKSGASADAAADSSLPPGATVGPAGFPTEQFTLTFEGNFFHLADLLQRLQALVRVDNDQVSVSGRLITLDAITLGAGSTGFPQMDATVSATTYLVPATQGLLNGATSSSPGTSSTSAVSRSTSSSSAAAPAVISAPTVR